MQIGQNLGTIEGVLDEENFIRIFNECAKRDWVQEFGTNDLKRLEALGYECEEKYLTQRAAKEHPEFDLDYLNKSFWGNCICPSPEAIGLLADLPNTFRIVNLTQPHKFNDDDEANLFDGCEAIILEGYLGSGANLVFRNFG